MIWFIIAIGFFWYFYDGLKAREKALVLIKNYCHNLNIQILDEAIVRSKIHLKRDSSGNLKIKRQFDFEFTAFDERRYHGQLIMLGQQVIDISVDPYLIETND